MRTITPALEAILRSRFEAAGSGYSARLEVDAYVLADPETADMNLLVGTVTDGGSTAGLEFHSPENANDAAGITTYTFSDSGVHGDFATIARRLKADLGSARAISAMTVYSENYDGHDPLLTVEYGDDGVSWTPVTGYVYVNTLYSGEINQQDIEFDEVTARWWRITSSFTTGAGLGFFTDMHVWSWEIPGSISSATYVTHSYRPKRININRNLRMGPDQAEIELANEDLNLGFGPTSIFPTNSRCRAYEWFGDVANEVLTFTGVIDKIADNRDPLTTSLSCRSMAGPILVDQTFGTIGPQQSGEAGVVRTQANGVYLGKEVDYVAADVLARAGWPSDLIDIAATSFVLDEFIVGDGSSWWDTLAQLAEFVGYTLWDDEDGVIHLRRLGAAAGVDDPLTVDYEYVIGAGL